MVRIQFPGNPESQEYPEDTENLAQFLICSMQRLLVFDIVS